MKNAYRLVLTLALVTSIADARANSYGNSPLFDMMKGMATGMLLLGQLGNTTSYPGYWPGAGNAYGWPAPIPGPYNYPPPQGWSPYATPGAPNAIESLQGSWETETGGLLVIKRNFARLYLDRDRYQDLELHADEQYLWMRPARGGLMERYDYVLTDEHATLRADDGRTLRMRRYRKYKTD